MKSSILAVLVLAGSGGQALTLADFPFERRTELKTRGQTYRGCARFFLAMRDATAGDLAAVDVLVRRATDFITNWRTASSPDAYFGDHFAESRSILDHAANLRARVRLPGPHEERLRGLLDALALIQIFDGYAASERELEELFQSALAQSSRMKYRDAIDDDQVARYHFALFLYRKQRMLADLVQTGDRKPPTDEVRRDRDEHFRVLRSDSNKFHHRRGRE